MNSRLETTKKIDYKNSLLELVKFAFAFMVLKGHGFTPLNAIEPGTSDCSWFGGAGIAVEFFFCIAGWFLIKSIEKHQRKYENLGLWRSWWKLFTNKMLIYMIPCIIPGLAVNIVTLFYDGGSPNGILWMYYFIHELILVTTIYYIIYFKVKDEKKRLYANIWLLIIGMIVRFGLRALALTNVVNLETLWEFWRALSFMSLGALCSRIPKIKAKKGWLWVFCLISVAICILIVTFPYRDIYKEICNIVTFPLAIYGCLLVSFNFKPFNYLGTLSKGLYFWQMVPWMLLKIGIYYQNQTLMNKWLLMGIAFALPIIEDLIRRLIKLIKKKKYTPEQIELNKKKNEERLYNIYKTKVQYFVVFIILACAFFCIGLGYGIYGLTFGGFKNFDWFVKNGRLTFNCAIVLTFIWLTPIPILLAINWKKQHNWIIKDELLCEKN